MTGVSKSANTTSNMLSQLDQSDLRSVHNDLRPLWQVLDAILEKELQATYEALGTTPNGDTVKNLQGRVALIKDLRGLPAQAATALRPAQPKEASAPFAL